MEDEKESIMKDPSEKELKEQKEEVLPSKETIIKLDITNPFGKDIKVRAKLDNPEANNYLGQITSFNGRCDSKKYVNIDKLQ